MLDTTSDQNATFASLGLTHGEVLTVQRGQPGTAATSTIGKTISPPRSPAKPLPNTSSTASLPLPATASPKKTPSPKPVAVRTDSEVPEGTITTAAANRKLPVRAPLMNASKIAENVQPGRNARPQQPSAPPLGTTAPSGAKPGLISTENAHVKVDGGWMVLRVVPDDKCVYAFLRSRALFGPPY